MKQTKDESKVEPKFKVGERITWASSSAGTWKDKTGDVLGVIAPGESIATHLRGKLGITVPKSRVKASDIAHDNARYLVKVDPPALKRRGTKGMREPDPVYYAPLVKVIDGDSHGRGKLVTR